MDITSGMFISLAMLGALIAVTSNNIIFPYLADVDGIPGTEAGRIQKRSVSTLQPTEATFSYPLSIGGFTALTTQTQMQLQCDQGRSVIRIFFIPTGQPDVTIPSIYCARWFSNDLRLDQTQTSGTRLMPGLVQQSPLGINCPEGFAVSGIKCTTAACAQYQLYCSQYTTTVQGKQMAVYFTLDASQKGTYCPNDQVIVGASNVAGVMSVTCAQPSIGNEKYVHPCDRLQKRGVDSTCYCLSNTDDDLPPVGFLSMYDVRDGTYQCLKPAEKYPIAKLLREEPPDSFRDSKPKYSGAAIAESFATLYNSIERLKSGTFGTVYKIRKKSGDAEYQILKAFKPTSNAIDRELEIGLIVSEKLVDTGLSDAFIKTFDYFHCDINAILTSFGQASVENEDKFWICLILEYIPGKDITDLITDMNITFTGISGSPPINRAVEFTRSVFFQVYHALKIARETINFAHLDMHTGNAMLAIPFSFSSPPNLSLRNEFFSLSVDGKTFRVPKSATGGARVKLIDYGWAGVTIGGKRIISSSKAIDMYDLIGGAPQDISTFFKTFRTKLKKDVWQSINSTTNGQLENLFTEFIELLRLRDARMYSKLLLNSDFFAQFKN